MGLDKKDEGLTHWSRKVLYIDFLQGDVSGECWRVINCVGADDVELSRPGVSTSCSICALFAFSFLALFGVACQGLCEVRHAVNEETFVSTLGSVSGNKESVRVRLNTCRRTLSKR
jgi:hypothetical protein